MARKLASSDSPNSMIWTMLGWSSREASCASEKNIAMKFGSWWRCWRIRFTTTVFSSPYAHSNLARKTSAIPPEASFRTSSYLPILATREGGGDRILPQGLVSAGSRRDTAGEGGERMRTTWLLIAMTVGLWACKGDKGDPGPAGNDGRQGPPGPSVTIDGLDGGTVHGDSQVVGSLTVSGGLVAGGTMLTYARPPLVLAGVASD